MDSSLKVERKRQGWSQAKIAEALGVSTRTVSRWEQGLVLPHPCYLEQLCELLGKTAEQLNLLPDTHDHDVPEALIPASFLVDPAIPEFLEGANSLLGRDKILMQVKECLFAANVPSFIALAGLPGIGKTVLAAALATDQQVQLHFRDGILWARLGPHSNVLGQLARWGELLGVLPSQVENIKSRDAWSRALQAAIGARQMLLIIDDARTAEDAQAFQVGGPGSVHLLTTRLSQVALAFAQQESIFISQLQEADSLALLARFVPDLVEQDPQGAQALVQAVGGLPLALTLMGKYLIQSFTDQPWFLRTVLRQFYDTQQRLGVSLSTPDEHTSTSLATAIPLNLCTIIVLCDQLLSPQVHAALCAPAVFSPQLESLSQEAALEMSQQSEEILDMLLDVGLLDTCGPEGYMLHQAVADYACIHNKVLITQQQPASFVVGDVQLDERDRYWPKKHCSRPQSLAGVVSTLEPLKLFSWLPSGIQSKVLLATLVILVGLLAFNSLFFLRSVLVSKSPETRTLSQVVPTPTPRMLWTTIDDRIEGTGIDQFNYVGNDWKYYVGDGCPDTPDCPYDDSNSWDNFAGDYVVFTFTGVQIKFYGVLDPQHGIGAVSIDGRNETMIDFYSAQRMGNKLMWTSPMLSAGTHTFKLRVTGKRNPNSSNTFVAVDCVDIAGPN